MSILRHPLSRRTFLKAGAAALALPLLDAMSPRGLRAEEAARAAAPKRLVIIQRPLGTYAPYFFPEVAGPEYVAPRLLEQLAGHRQQFTVFSGMSHPGYPNNHGSEFGLLTGVHPDGFKHWDDIHNTISLDQAAAETVGQHTRVPYLLLGGMGTGLSFSRKGVPLPGNTRLGEVFARLFLDGSPEEIAQDVRRLQDGRSILDGMRDQLAALGRQISASDRRRMEVLTSTIREAEQSLTQDEAWANRPKPQVTVQPGNDAGEWVGHTRQWYDLIHLALQTDSTRVIVYRFGEYSPASSVPGINLGEHDASHHGQDPKKIEQVALFEQAHFASFNHLLTKLADTRENAGSLLDATQVLFISNLGDASAHASNNLPVLLAGGGYRHRGHVAYDRHKNHPLANLYVRMLRQMGIATDSFGTSTGVVNDLG
jgi:Protein of unknown function (DUF1552)